MLCVELFLVKQHYLKQRHLAAHNFYQCLDSPYGELKFAPPKAYFIDLRQIRANSLQILTKFINIHKMHVQNIQGCHFLRKKSPCGTLHNIAKGLVPLFAVNHSAICRYLLLFAANHSAICRYLPLAFPLFAAICRQPFHYLPLFAANNVNRKLPIRVI